MSTPDPAAPGHPAPVHVGPGTVTAAPLRWLRLEGFALLVSAVVGFGVNGRSWWLFAALLLAPDVGAVGYVINLRVGAVAYNIAHVTVLPLALLSV